MFSAVILAAGKGERLRPLTESLPKCLIPINGKPLIEYSLDCLKDNGVTDVTIVVGYKGDRIKSQLGSQYNGVALTYIENEAYASAGSMSSLARVTPQGTILLLESDLLYEPAAIRHLLTSPEDNILLTAPCSGSGDEVYVLTKRNHLQDLGKNHPEKEHAIGELVGICKLSQEFVREMQALEQPIDDYEYVLLETSKRLPVFCLKKPLHWIEIDTEEDLERAKNKIFPAITARNA